MAHDSRLPGESPSRRQRRAGRRRDVLAGRSRTNRSRRSSAGACGDRSDAGSGVASTAHGGRGPARFPSVLDERDALTCGFAERIGNPRDFWSKALRASDHAAVITRPSSHEMWWLSRGTATWRHQMWWLGLASESASSSTRTERKTQRSGADGPDEQPGPSDEKTTKMERP